MKMTVGDRQVLRTQIGDKVIWDSRQYWEKYSDPVHPSWISGLNFRFVDEVTVAYQGFLLTGSDTKIIIFPPEGYNFTSFVKTQCDPGVVDGSYSISSIVNSRDTHYISKSAQAMKIVSDNGGKKNYITPYISNLSAKDVSELLIGISQDLMLNVEKISN